MDSVRFAALAAGSPAKPSERSRSIRAYEANRTLTLLLSDLAMLAVASWTAVACISHSDHMLVYSRILQSAIIWTVASIWVFKTLGLYKISFALSSRDEWYYVILGLAIGIAPLMLVFTIVPALSSSRLVLLASFGLSAVLVGTSRCLIHYRCDVHPGRRKRRIALVATPDDLAQIAAAMQGSSIALSRVRVDGTDRAMAEALDGTGSWYDRLREQGCDEIVFAGMPTSRTALMVERAARDHITIGFAPAGLPSQPYRLEVLRSQRQPVFVAGRAAACTPLNVLLKRLFDVAVAGVGLILTSPLMLVAMLAVLLESGKPVLYRQTRIGRGGKPFEILKLRSMRQDAETRCGAMWAVGDPAKDGRTTKIGAFIRKTSIDELPQFVNVLRGDMSIVGPRPERPIFVEQFRKEHVRYDERHLVSPGITGWAHIHMPRSPGLDELGERLDLDLFYIENYSLLLDIFVTFKTAVEVLFQRWA